MAIESIFKLLVTTTQQIEFGISPFLQKLSYVRTRLKAKPLGQCTLVAYVSLPKIPS